MNVKLEEELKKIAYINDALAYIRDLPHSALYQYQEITGIKGYDADRYSNFEWFLNDLFRSGIDAKKFTMDSVKILLDLKLKDSVTYMLIAEKNKDVIGLLTEPVKSEVRRYLIAKNRIELAKISKKQDNQKYFDYCLKVVLDSQLLIEKKSLGIHSINSEVLPFCGIKESSATELALMHISKVYAKKAISLEKEWKNYERMYLTDKKLNNPNYFKSIASSEKLISQLKLQ